MPNPIPEHTIQVTGFKDKRGSSVKRLRIRIEHPNWAIHVGFRYSVGHPYTASILKNLIHLNSARLVGLQLVLKKKKRPTQDI